VVRRSTGPLRRSSDTCALHLDNHSIRHTKEGNRGNIRCFCKEFSRSTFVPSNDGKGFSNGPHLFLQKLAATLLQVDGIEGTRPLLVLPQQMKTVLNETSEKSVREWPDCKCIMFQIQAFLAHATNLYTHAQRQKHMKKQEDSTE